MPYPDSRIINLIVQKRVREGQCIDCGAKLTTSPGYCVGSKYCGGINTPTLYTEEEYRLAKIKHESRIKRPDKERQRSGMYKPKGT